LNHSVLWQATVSMLQAYVMLAQSCNPSARTSRQYLIGRQLHGLQAHGVILVT
jgi:hypothetical protein